MPFYLTPKQDDFNQIPELQVSIAEGLYDIESILSDPGGYPYKEIVKLRDQIVSNLERAWEITGRSEDQLTGTMLQISQVVATVSCQPNCQPTVQYRTLYKGMCQYNGIQDW